MEQAIVIGKPLEKDAPKFEAEVRETKYLEFKELGPAWRQQSIEDDIEYQKEQQKYYHQISTDLLKQLLAPEKLENHKYFAIMFEA